MLSFSPTILWLHLIVETVERPFHYVKKKRPSNPAVGIYMMKDQKNASAFRS